MFGPTGRLIMYVHNLTTFYLIEMFNQHYFDLENWEVVIISLYLVEKLMRLGKMYLV